MTFQVVERARIFYECFELATPWGVSLTILDIIYFPNGTIQDRTYVVEIPSKDAKFICEDENCKVIEIRHGRVIYECCNGGEVNK